METVDRICSTGKKYLVPPTYFCSSRDSDSNICDEYNESSGFLLSIKKRVFFKVD